MNRTLCLFAALALSTACEPQPPEACIPDDAPWEDQDADGFPVLDDCDDYDETVHPNAFDKCDGIDNDCNGIVDDGYPDVDGDGEADCSTNEICNGVDDDGDGRIDEGFPDFDGDHDADCLDDACDVLVDPSGGTVSVDEECSRPDVTVTDPWNVAIEWQWKDGTSTYGSYATPVIGRFIDTDRDGDVDTDDVPVIVITTNTGALVAVRGDTGAEVLRVSGVQNYAGAALVDIDGDGDVEAVTMDTARRPIAIDRDGRIEWTATVAEPNFYGSPIAADVDGDGIPEVITQTKMYDGATGALETDFGTPAGVPYYIPTVGDIDLDGEQEILIGQNVYAPDGTVKWSHSIAGNYGHWAAIVNLDGDSEGEVIVVGGSEIGIFEHDGTVIDIVSTSGAFHPGPICVADFDGDGVVEMAWASSAIFAVYELNGRQIWSTTVNDSSGLAGCSGYDIDGDNTYEVLFADQDTFYIFDGPTGRVNYSQAGHNSGTLFEYPTVADVDGDNSAEIVITSNYHSSAWGAITVFGHNGDGWLEAGDSWPVHDYAVTNVNPDGTIPAVPDAPWTVHNVYRARPAVDYASSNLSIEITDVCVSSCDEAVGTVGISVEITNDGATPIDQDIPFTLYAVDGSVMTPLTTQYLVGGIAGGTRSAGMRVDLDVGDLGTDGFLVMVDNDGTERSWFTECDESDNIDDWPYAVCD